jgi:hypothetical protein
VVGLERCRIAPKRVVIKLDAGRVLEGNRAHPGSWQLSRRSEELGPAEAKGCSGHVMAQTDALLVPELKTDYRHWSVNVGTRQA